MFLYIFFFYISFYSFSFFSMRLLSGVVIVLFPYSSFFLTFEKYTTFLAIYTFPYNFSCFLFIYFFIVSPLHSFHSSRIFSLFLLFTDLLFSYPFPFVDKISLVHLRLFRIRFLRASRTAKKYILIFVAKRENGRKKLRTNSFLYSVRVQFILLLLHHLSSKLLKNGNRTCLIVSTI